MPEIGGTNYRQLQIVYEDDSVEGDAGVPERGSYALDQVKYLKEVLPEYQFAYRVAFRLAQPGDPTQLEVRAGSLGQNEQDRQQPPLAGHDFDFIVRHLRDRAQGETRVLVLVALYENILHFGKALLNADDGLSAWYVLGPRDVLEQTQDISFFKPSVQRGGRARLPLRTLTVGELNANAAGARPLKRAFVQKYKGETITSQVVQMYDALSLLDEAVGTTNKDLCPMVDCDQGKAQFDLEFYREELRHKIAAIQHTGAGGTTTFDQSGDSKGDVYWKGLRDGKMQGLDPLTSKD